MKYPTQKLPELFSQKVLSDKTLGDVLLDLWKARLYIGSGILVGAWVAMLFVFTVTPFYKTKMLLSPTNPMDGAEISSLLANDNLFALRYLVQRVGVTNASDFMRFEHVYAGPSVAAVLLRDQNIINGLNADRPWGYGMLQRNWSPEELARYIERRVWLEPVGTSPLRRFVYEHPSRSFGVYFLTQLHAITDQMIRENIRRETARRITYLQQTIQDTPNPEHRRALTTLLLEQERLRMLVSLEEAYAASVLEKASADVRATWPHAPLSFSLLMLVGGFLGLILFNLLRGRS